MDYVAISDGPTVTQPGLFRGSGRLLAGLLGLMLVVCSVRPLATAYAEGVLFASHRSQRQPGPARNRPGPARNQPGPAQNRPGHGGPSGLQLVPPSIFDPKAPDKFHASGGGARGAMVDGERSWPSCVFLYGMLLQHSRQDCLGNLLDGPTGPPAQRQASYVKGSQPLCTETWLRLKQPGEKAVLTWPFAFLTGRPGDQLHGETWCWPSGELAQEKMRQIEGVIGFDSAVLKRFVVSAVLQNGTAQQAAAYLQDPKPSPEEQDLLCKGLPGKPTASRALEQQLQEEGFKVVAGVDEVGRGPLAGPVMAAAIVIPPDVNIPGITDSKQLTAKQRETLFNTLTSHPRVMYAVSSVDVARIDEINIFQATLEAMSHAVASLPVRPDRVLVDGTHVPKDLQDRGVGVVNGDSESYLIAAASIVAKVTRDRLMEGYHEQWPHYQFKLHKGYGTKAHLAAIEQHGPCPIHRWSFAPMKKMPEETRQHALSKGAASIRIILFTKPECTLCVPVWKAIERVALACNQGVLSQCAGAVRAYQVDISAKANARWFEEYKYDIPVVHVDRNDISNGGISSAHATRHISPGSTMPDEVAEQAVLWGVNPENEVVRHRMTDQQLLEALEKLPA